MKIAGHLFGHFLISDLILEGNSVTRITLEINFTSFDTEGVILEKAKIKWLCLTTVLIGGWGSVVVISSL